MYPNKINIKGKNFKAECKCMWYEKLFCSCDYKNKMTQKAILSKKAEHFCNQKGSGIKSRKPFVQTLDKTENYLYLHRTMGPGAYSYAQPKIELCESDVIGYNTGRDGLLPLNKKEIDLESSLRYSESVSLKPYNRPMCKDKEFLERQYTREIGPLNDISAIDYNRFQYLPCDPQGHISTNSYKLGEDTKNKQNDVFFKNYRKGF